MEQLLSYGVEKNRKKFKMFQGISIFLQLEWKSSF